MLAADGTVADRIPGLARGGGQSGDGESGGTDGNRGLSALPVGDEDAVDEGQFVFVKWFTFTLARSPKSRVCTSPLRGSMPWRYLPDPVAIAAPDEIGERDPLPLEPGKGVFDRIPPRGQFGKALVVFLLRGLADDALAPLDPAKTDQSR